MEAYTQCVNCANLTIEHLVDLAHKEFSRDGRVPSAAYYQLHDSIEDLEIAADAGCHFCKLLLACLKGYPDTGNWIADEWEGEGCNPETSLLAFARRLPQSEVKICIVSDDSDPKDTFADVRVLDTLSVQVGPYDPGFHGDEPEYDEAFNFPLLKLTLASSRGTCGTYVHYGHPMSIC